MRIVGYKEMVAHLKRTFGVEVSVRTLYRYVDPDYAETRGITPLPVEHGVGGQHMIQSRLLDAWVAHNLRRKHA